MCHLIIDIWVLSGSNCVIDFYFIIVMIKEYTSVISRLYEQDMIIKTMKIILTCKN